MTLPKISSAMLVLTHECNLRCRYCFVEKKAERMSFDVALAAAQFLIKNAEENGDIPHINFFGGEPTLMWDSVIVPLTTWIRQEYKKPFTLGMTTNGILLSDDKISFMKKNKIGLLFSIDGAKETQDYNRPHHDGSGSFDTLRDIIPKIAANFPNATFRGTIIPETCRYTFDNIMFAKNSGFSNFYMVPNVFETWTDESKVVLMEEFNRYVDYYINEYRAGRSPIQLSTLEDAFLDIKKINMAIDKQHYRVMRQCHACGKCGLGSNRNASIHPNGDIYGCQEMTSNEGHDGIFYIGNVYSGVDDARRISLMNLFDSTQATGLNCDTCKYTRICNGGCVANNYLINGSLHINPPMYCWWQQIILDAAIRIMQTLGNEHNIKFRAKWRLIR